MSPCCFESTYLNTELLLRCCSNLVMLNKADILWTRPCGYVLNRGSFVFWQVSLQKSVFFSHLLSSSTVSTADCRTSFLSFNTIEALSSVLIENYRNLRTRHLVGPCGQQLAHRSASACIGQLESTILVNSKEF
jgi:hypothetical protein